jgi:hypothetical protein
MTLAMTLMSTVLLMQGRHIMAAISPPPDKGGIPPGTNVVNAFTPTHAVIGEGPYYVSPVLTDGQLNAFTSELLVAVHGR